MSSKIVGLTLCFSGNTHTNLPPVPHTTAKAPPSRRSTNKSEEEEWSPRRKRLRRYWSQQQGGDQATQADAPSQQVAQRGPNQTAIVLTQNKASPEPEAWHLPGSRQEKLISLSPPGRHRLGTQGAAESSRSAPWWSWAQSRPG